MKPPLTDEEIRRSMRDVRNAIAQQELEGLTVSEETKADYIASREARSIPMKSAAAFTSAMQNRHSKNRPNSFLPRGQLPNSLNRFNSSAAPPCFGEKGNLERRADPGDLRDFERIKQIIQNQIA